MNRRVYPLSPQAVRLETPDLETEDSLATPTYSAPFSPEVDMNSTSQASHLYSVRDNQNDSIDDDVQVSTNSSGEDEIITQPTLILDSPEFNQMKPGARLRYIREQKNLSLESVADKLYLNHSVIQAIEADDYTRLPSRVFVRGYIRSYAKLLEIPADSLLEAFGADETTPISQPLLKAPVKHRKQMTSRDSWVIVGTVAIILVLMLLMALWHIYPEISLSGNSDNTNETPAPLPTSIDANGTAIPIPVPLNGGTTNSSTEYTPPSESSTDTPETSTNEGQNGQQSIPVAIPITINQPSASTTPVEPIVIQPNAPTGTTVAEHNPNALVLKFTQKTWIEVQDSTNKVLYNGTASAGSQQNLTGTPPFKFKVGNIFGVTVDYNGTTIDSNSTPVKVQRRFSLGTAPAPASTNEASATTSNTTATANKPSNNTSSSALSREQATTRPSFE